MPRVSDSQYLLRAIKLAQKGGGHTRPNPPVGAVIIKNGVVIGEGYHKRCGQDHAEVAAIKNCKISPKGATLYVTLEPCSKPGRVGACTEAIAKAGIKQVLYACPDPNPKNCGCARRVLKASGINCEQYKADKAVLLLAKKLIAPFKKYITTKVPYVTVKIAMSLDGKICDRLGKAKWISSAQSRELTGAFRERVDAIMVGAETIRKDNPSLLSHGKPNKDLIRVIISKSGKLPKKAQVFTDGKNETLVFNSPKAALTALGKRGVMHVLCEGGLNLATSMAESGLVDEWITIIAPKVIGSKAIAKAIKFGSQDTIIGGDSCLLA